MILTPCDEVLDMFPDTSGGGSGKVKYHNDNEYSEAHEGYKRPNKSMYTHKNSDVIASYGDSGSAARFFYQIKNISEELDEMDFS